MIRANLRSTVLLLPACFALCAQPASADLVGYWNFDDVLGSPAADRSGTGNDGTIVGGTTFTTDVPTALSGQSATFDGSGRIEVPHAASLSINDTLSIAYWLRADNTAQPGGFTRPLGKGGNGGTPPGWEFQQNSSADGVSVRVDTTGGTNQLKTSMNGLLDDSWQHVVMTLDTGTVATYVDGTLNASDTYNHGGGFANTNALVLGARNTGGGNALNGSLDNVALYNSVLSPTQIGFLAAGGAANATAQYTHESGVLTDDTGNGNTLVNTGGVGFSAPISPGPLALGSNAGDYTRTGGQHLDPPAGVYTPGDDFTFTSFTRKNSDESGGHQTILGSSRFRFQFRNTGSTSDGAGTLRLDVNGAGASGPGESGDGTLLTEQWYFTALTYDTTTNQIQAWLQTDSPVFLGPAFTRTANGGTGIDDMTGFQIGSDDGASGIGGADAWGGQIDSEQFFSASLTKRELREIFRQANPVPGGTVGLVSEYGHEGADPLVDDTGNRVDLTNGGGVTFVAPTDPGDFLLGSVAGDYPRTGSGYLAPPELYTEGDDFTFLAMVRQSGDETGGHQTILGSDRFRFQWNNSGSTSDGLGELRLDVNGAGASGPTESGDGTFATEAWRFVALSYDSTTNQISAYLQDGSLVFEGPAFERTALGALGLDDMDSFRIGADGLSGIGSADAWSGQIDRVRFYDEALSPTELRDVFRTYLGATTGTLGLVSRYDHEPADVLADKTGQLPDLVNGGGVVLVAPPAPTNFVAGVGTQVGEYDRTVTDYFDVPNPHTPGDDFTFAAIVRKDSDTSGGHQTILSSDEFRFQFQSGQNLYLQGVGAGTATTPGGSFLAEEWYFVALRYDAATGTAEVFFQDDSQNVLGGPAMTLGGLDWDDMDTFRLGMDGLSGLGGDDPWSGWIDNAQFFDVALDNDQLQALFLAQVPEPSSLLLATIGLLGLATRRRRTR